jgi:DNA processing protein
VSNPGRNPGESRPAAPRRRTRDPIRLARVALACLAADGDVRAYRLAEVYGPEEALDRLLAGDEPDFDVSRYGALRPRAAEILRRTRRLRGVRVVTPEDGEWPGQLQELAKLDHATVTGRRAAPPLCLWVRGKPALDELLHQSVAVVGGVRAPGRRWALQFATSYGSHVAAELGQGLAENGWTVVSGGEYGIDGAAHRGVLTAKGSTMAVLPYGVDLNYPAGHTALFERIRSAGGLLVSPWPPGTPPMKYRYELGAAVIAAIAHGVVMVEAPVGAQVIRTMEQAATLGRPTMVVPGPVTSTMSAGCHQFLRQHANARLVTDAAEVINEIALFEKDGAM